VRYASFFTGAGGLDLGLDQAGWERVFSNDNDPAACETLRANGMGGTLWEGDVRCLDPKRLRREVGTGEGLAVVGGPPCQSFSTAGKRLGLNDERGNVFLAFLELAVALEPDLIVIENVRGLLSAPLRHRPHAERGPGSPPLGPEELRGGALRHVLSRLEGGGYEATVGIYDAAHFGVPQRRERLVVVASRSGRPSRFAPTHGPGDWRTFREAVEGVSGCDHVPFRPRQARFVAMLGPGQNWRSLPEPARREAMGRALYSGGGRTGFYRRLAWDEPSPTLVTCPTMPATLLAHPEQLRPLSVQEYARLQTFPDAFRFVGTLRDRYRLIGNAVPVAFAAEIGRQALTAEQNIWETPGPPSGYGHTGDSPLRAPCGR
jgi:DNA (cytosine-5)-methyltransferase 1